ncbi:peptide synthase PvdJ [Pseudomonas aeruginosa NCMG1179]|nr:peptide synthase PvdJ [Pseudomonas aeruginosa NCMG1179]
MPPELRPLQWHGFATDVDLPQGTVGTPWLGQGIEQEQVPVRRGQVGKGHALLDYLPIQLTGIPEVAATQDHAGTTGQRRIELFDEAVEAQGGELQYPILRGERGITTGDTRELRKRRMADGHALGFSGGAGGVDHIGQVLRPQVHHRIIRRHRCVPFQAVDGEHLQPFVQRQPGQQMLLAEQQADGAVLEHVTQTVLRIGRVQRHIGTTGLENRQQTDHHVQRALDGDSHQHIGTDATRYQAVSQTIGAGVELGVAQGLPLQRQCLRLRTQTGLLLDLQLDQGRQPTLVGVLCPGPQQAIALLVQQQRQLGDRPARFGHDAAQEILPVPSQALDGRGIEQIRGIAERCPDTVLGLVHVQRQVEGHGAAPPLHPLQRQAWQLHALVGRTRVGLVIEHDLEQRVVAEAAFRLQSLHQLLERQVLVRLCLQRALAGLSQQLVETHPAIDVGLEHLGVDEETDQPLGFNPVTVGDRHADTDIRLSAIAMQQRLEGSQQQHEHGHTLALNQLFQGKGQVWLQLQVQLRSTIAAQRLPRVIEGQLQHRLLAAQQAGPVRQLALLFPRLHPAALPQGVVRVLDRQGRQHHVEPLAVAGIELDQFLDHQLHRPTVGDDMVLDHDQHMLVGVHLQQSHPQ